MSSAPEYLAREYAKALRRLAEADEGERHVRALLQRADERRAEGGSEVRRWNRVVNRLEIALDFAKATQAHWEGEVTRYRRRAQKAGACLETIELNTSENDEAKPVGIDPLGAAEDTLEKLDEEDHAALSEIAEEVQASKAEPILEEPAKQPPALDARRPAYYPSLEERRRIRRLRQAVDKLAGRHFDLLTLREIALVIEARELWSSQDKNGDGPNQLRRALDALCGEVRASLEDWARALNQGSTSEQPQDPERTRQSR